MPTPVHFQFAADDPQRAAEFYKDVFGWTIKKFETPKEYWLIDTGKKGVDGGMMRRSQSELQGTVNMIEVPSIDDFLAKIQQKGGQLVSEKRGRAGLGTFAYCTDTEGNLIGLLEREKLGAKELTADELEAVLSAGGMEAMHYSKW
jgi:predicted enzyme related to lactoylglutathione lyase